MNKRLLVINNEPAIRHILETDLCSEGFLVVCAEDMESGLEYLGGNDPDLVISDFRCPEMEGLDIVRAITWLRPWLPIIIISGLLEEAGSKEALAAGRVDFLKKPFTKAALLDIVNRLVSSSGVLPADA